MARPQPRSRPSHAGTVVARGVRLFPHRDEPGARHSRERRTGSAIEKVLRNLGGRRPAVFLDYDGTLTPIVSRPELALLSAATRLALERLSRVCPVAVVSGRDLSDVRRLVGLQTLVYAGSHGFEIEGPHGLRLQHEAGRRCAASLERAHAELERELRAIAGAQLERKRYALAAHYRNVAAENARRVERAVDATLEGHPGLVKTAGKMVFELRPAADWDKGRAVLWMLEALRLDSRRFVPLYVGDDTTDEDAFRALRQCGICFRVGEDARPTAASHRLRDTGEVRRLLDALAEHLEREAPAGPDLTA